MAAAVPATVKPPTTNNKSGDHKTENPFQKENRSEKQKHTKKRKHISGLSYHANVLTPEEEEKLISWITRADAPWESATGTRCVQQYGHRYDYEKRCIVKDGAPRIPEVLHAIANALLKNGLLKVKPTQIIINRYLPGEGIAPHTDHKDFGDEVSSLSLGAYASMYWSNEEGKPLKTVLEARSLVVMCGEARYKRTHSVPGDKKRPIRYSFTMRTLACEDKKK